MKNLLKISLSISLIGIFLLLVISNTLQPKITAINQINNKSIDKKAQITGNITKIRNYPESDFQIITIKDETGEIDVTLDKILNLTNEKVRVTGKIIEYNGKLEIQADKIIVV